ncbi:unnamed protein product [Rodentolepis nana]|uniref:CNNM transmembrane domain-containing protein n=1 Tax=Rodentolepis nana TaxID=102285 RepID=A0A0R3TFK0_RODNA|nr:unnamed protein product [Rodentolepis nana]
MVLITTSVVITLGHMFKPISRVPFPTALEARVSDQHYRRLGSRIIASAEKMFQCRVLGTPSKIAPIRVHHILLLLLSLSIIAAVVIINSGSYSRFFVYANSSVRFTACAMSILAEKAV